MKQHTVIKLGICICVLLFCIAAGLYWFAQMSYAKEEADVDMLQLVPSDCVGLVESDNLDYIFNELPQTAYAEKLRDFFDSGLLSSIFDNIGHYVADGGTHGISNQVLQMLVSFHEPVSPENVVIYFRMGETGKSMLKRLFSSAEHDNATLNENYRGKSIQIHEAEDSGLPIVTYSGNGFLVMSNEKSLIERVIDAQKDKASLVRDRLAKASFRRVKPANHLTILARTPSMPLLTQGDCDSWCEFDIHVNSEVFYLSGSMHVPDSCLQGVNTRLDTADDVNEEGLLIVSGQDEVDSCIASTAAIPSHSLFEECVANLSRDASFIMVTDLEKAAEEPERYAGYLPTFLQHHISMFRPFILSLQITKMADGLSHIFVFTYKE